MADIIVHFTDDPMTKIRDINYWYEEGGYTVFSLQDDIFWSVPTEKVDLIIETRNEDGDLV